MRKEGRKKSTSLINAFKMRKSPVKTSAVARVLMWAQKSSLKFSDTSSVFLH